MTDEFAPEDTKLKASGYETSDAAVKPVIVFLGALGILIVVAIALMAGLFTAFDSYFGRSGVTVSPLVDIEQIPTGPRLQSDPAEELAEVEAWEDQRLKQYKWIDKDTGTFQIPIERAIQLVAETGLPARKEGEVSLQAD
jgi:hypothetical protein